MPMLTLGRGGFSDKQVKDVLHSISGTREVRFRYDLLNKKEQKLSELNNVIDGEVSFGAFNDIKRTAKFKIRDTGNINFASDRIQPFMEIKMPEQVVPPKNLVDDVETLSKHVWSLPGNQTQITDLGSVNNGSKEIRNYFQRTGTAGSDHRIASNTSNSAYTIDKTKDYTFAVDIKVNQIATSIQMVINGNVVSNVPNSEKIFADLRVDGGITLYSSCTVLKNIVLSDGYRHVEIKIPASFWSGTGNNCRLLQFAGWANLGIYDFYYRRPNLIATTPVVIGAQWIEFPLGIFLLSSPERSDESGAIFRDVEAYDGLVVLRDDKFDTYHTIPAGTKYYDAMVSLLAGAGITKYNIEYTDKVLPVDAVYEIGTTKLSAFNDLVSQLNYTPIRVDVNGFFVTATYVSPADRPQDYTYKDDELSVTFNGMTESADLFDIANKWVVVLSNAEQEPLISTYVNENPDSITSNPSRGRYITDFRKVDKIADQTSLDAYTRRLAFEASQIYGKLKFETAIMPMHEYFDVLKIEYSPLSINEKFSETNWSFNLKAGAHMVHEARRVVNV